MIGILKNPQKQMNKQNKNKLIDTENRFVVTREVWRGGMGKMGEEGQLYSDGWLLDLWR